MNTIPACRARSLLLALALSAAAGTAVQAQGGLDTAIEQAFDHAGLRLGSAVQNVATNRYPSITSSGGAWTTTSSSDWTSGFFPGCLWTMYAHTGDPTWRAEAEAWLVALEGQKDDTSTHDVGFKIFPSFARGYELTGVDDLRQVALDGAASLATRYSPIVGAIRSWNGPSSSDFRVIIDNMMNLEILFWGASHGGPSTWRDMAVSHALRTRAEHVRADGSTYQVVNFDPTDGSVQWKDTHQGHDAESTWSRGQGWAVYGFTMVYRETLDARFLGTARLAADYFVTHLPADSVPYWDFELPSFAGEPRDSSAAAVGAAGLLELAHLEPDTVRAATYLAAARDILASLTSPAYLSEGTSNAAVLLHGTRNRPDGSFDTGLIYGDHYFLVALQRYQEWFGVAPFAEDVVVETAKDEPVSATLSGSDTQECELVFTLVDAPAHGTLGFPSQEPCVPGTPNHDTAHVLYTPEPSFTGGDSFSYRVSDGVHSSELAEVSVTVTEGGGTSATFVAQSDSKVSSGSPGSSYGSETTLRVRAADPEWRTYVRFAVSGVAGSVSSAHLRLFVTDGSSDGGTVFATGSAWSESTLAWNNAPPSSGNALDAAGAIAADAWAEYEVTGAVSGNGTISFLLVSTSTDSAYFSSREGAHAPELVVTWGEPPGDTTPPQLVARSPSSGASSVPVDADVTATFDEPVQGVDVASFVLRHEATPVTATVTYDGPTRTARLDPTVTLLPSTTYTVELTAAIADLAAPPNALVPLSWSFTTAAGAAGEQTFLAVADAMVKSTSPGTNYGSDTALRVRASSPEYQSYLRFQVSGLAGGVRSARLRLFATDGSDDAGSVFVTGTSWSESALTWSNAPSPSGGALDSAGTVETGAWVEYDVTNAVSGNGTYAFALTSGSTDSAYFSSREGAHPPELVLSSGPDDGPTNRWRWTRDPLDGGSFGAGP